MFGQAVVTAQQMAVITDAATENVAVILPAGLAILAILVGVSLLPKIISKFLG